MDRNKLKAKVDPASTALVIIDMQKDYCCEGGTFHRRGFDVRPAQEVAAKLNLFLEKTRGVLQHIVHLRMTKVAALSSPVSAELYERLGVERGYDPAYAEFYEVVPREGETVIPKYTYSGFVSTYLDRFLRANDIKTLVITGIATNICVDSTARDAFMRGYYVVVPSDLTEGTSAEATRHALLNIDGFYGEVVDSESLLRCWDITV
ncbi:MAG: isochorismatase family cysteine hydrolase [Syntrophorhabdales bacterium]|jgi:ureidoacrylate peracid hydrolase